MPSEQPRHRPTATEDSVGARILAAMGEAERIDNAFFAAHPAVDVYAREMIPGEFGFHIAGSPRVFVIGVPGGCLAVPKFTDGMRATAETRKERVCARELARLLAEHQTAVDLAVASVAGTA
jgi:hypothetical protein